MQYIWVADTHNVKLSDAKYHVEFIYKCALISRSDEVAGDIKSPFPRNHYVIC